MTSVKFTTSKDESVLIKHLEQVLSSETELPYLVSSQGEKILLPESIYQAFCQVVKAMATGQAITIIPYGKEMTTQQAADFLNVSWPYLIKLLEQGEIPYTKVGSHRRILSQDIMNYKKQRDAQRRQHLRELTAFMQEEGFYDEDNYLNNQNKEI